MVLGYWILTVILGEAVHILCSELNGNNIVVGEQFNKYHTQSSKS
jgi:hypothetical protein